MRRGSEGGAMRILPDGFHVRRGFVTLPLQIRRRFAAIGTRPRPSGIAMTSFVQSTNRLSIVAASAFVAFSLGACGKKAPATESKEGPVASQNEKPAQPSEQQTIRIDGSSTVLPISEAVAEEFEKETKTRVTVASSGTGGGFKKFCSGEIEIAGASRPIKSSEAEACAAKGIEFVELPVAFDGLAVVVHKDNTWAKSMTVAELKKMWEKAAQEKVTKWSDVRAGWPDEAFNLFGAGVDSGTYDYFTKAINGEEHSSRGDYNSSEDDNILVKGISTDKNALGFFGYAYYEANKNDLALVAIDDEVAGNGDGPILPSPTTINDATYQPLARPIFIYASKKAAKSKSVADFVTYYVSHAATLSKEVGYVPLPASTYELAAKRFSDRVTGSLFSGGSTTGVSIDELLKSKPAAVSAGVVGQ
jgi:phosphate transport system substrate-binding protein